MTSPRVAPGLLSWPAWQALRSADLVLAPAGHPQLPALDEAEIRYQLADEADARSLAADAVVAWLPEPGTDPPVPAGAQLIRASADLPGAHLTDLVATMDRLRAECPWDARQTHASLAPHLLEEPYEALEALESGDEQAFCEELGDVLLQVVFHARIAAERDDGTSFTVDDVADGIVAKLVRRHPHVFADVTVSGAEEVKRNWDEIKREEKRERAERSGVTAVPAAPSALDGVPFGQPALALAAQLQRRAARAASPRTWPALTAMLATRIRPIPPRTSAASSSVWWRRLVRRDVIRRWSCAPRHVATATSSAPGSARSSANSFSLASVLGAR